MGLLHIAVLGSPEVFHDGIRLTVALRKAQALLLYLAVEGGTHPRSHLLSEHELLGLNPQAPLELDLEVVQQAWKEARRLSTVSPEPQRAALVAQLQQALALVRGPFLDGFWLREETAFDEWHGLFRRQSTSSAF